MQRLEEILIIKNKTAFKSLLCIKNTTLTNQITSNKFLLKQIKPKHKFKNL